MGRILRVGTDTVTNYTFLQTSAYDENAPAATTSPWADSAAMDQRFDQPAPTGVVAQGVLITFARFPDTFLGAMVKVEPTYDTGAGEHPFLEMWTHDSVTTLWTRRRRIDLLNLFVGIPSGTRKVADLTFFPFLRTVDKVWITMDPGAVGTPTMEFFAIQVFGQCEQSLRKDHPNTDGDPCANPNDPFYTGFKEDGVTPCPGTTFGPPTDGGLPPIDVCNPASVEQYRDALRNIPGALDQFDAWFNANATTIALLCSGIDANPPNTPVLPPMPLPPLPPLPELDLCSQDSIDAFRAALAGDADAVANFDAFIDQLESDGFFDANCATPPPDEAYVDPNTLEPAPEPDTDNNTPFGAGPGGQPQFPRAGDRPGNGSGSPEDSSLSFPFFFFYNATDQANFVANFATEESTEIQEQYALALAQGNVQVIGTDSGPGTRQQTTVSNIQFLMSGVPPGTFVGLRSLIQYPIRRTVPFGPGNPLANYHTYLTSYHQFGAYIEGPVVTAAGYSQYGWEPLDPALWIPTDGVTIDGHKVFKKTGEDILTLAPATAIVNEVGPDVFGRVGHDIDTSDFLLASIETYQDRFTRVTLFCVNSTGLQAHAWYCQEFPFALYIHIELRPGFAPFNSDFSTITPVVNMDGSNALDTFMVAEHAANAVAGDPPSDEIPSFYQTFCVF